jgi:MCP family monocarboxylic acid transporter-like MFS transporter 10
MGEIADVGRRIGMSMTILTFGVLAGLPISGAINSASGGFEAVGYYAGKAHLHRSLTQGLADDALSVGRT